MADNRNFNDNVPASFTLRLEDVGGVLHAVHIPCDSSGALVDPIPQTIFGATNETAPATDTAASGLNGRLQRIAVNLSSVIKNEDVASAGADPGLVINLRRTDTPAATSGTDGDYEPFQGSGGYLWIRPPKLVKVSHNFNRPANTTPYTANDSVSDNATAGSVTLPSFAITAGSGTLRRVRLKKSNTAVATPTLRLWLYDATLTVGAGDNDAFAHPITNSLGYVDVATTFAGSDTVAGFANTDIPFSVSTLYAQIQTLSGFTPASAETFTIDLWYQPS